MAGEFTVSVTTETILILPDIYGIEVMGIQKAYSLWEPRMGEEDFDNQVLTLNISSYRRAIPHSNSTLN